MRSRLAVSLPRRRLSAWPGTQVPACFLLSEAMTTHHLPLTRPRPFTMEVEPFLFFSGLYRLFRGHQVPGSTRRETRCMAVSCPLAFMSSSFLPADRAETMWAWMSSSISRSSVTFSSFFRTGLPTTGMFWKYRGME